MRKLEERLLECVLGFHSVAEDAVYEAEHLGIELREERVEALFCSGALLGHLLLELQHAGFRCVVAIHRQNTTAPPFSDTRWPPPIPALDQPYTWRRARDDVAVADLRARAAVRVLPRGSRHRPAGGAAAERCKGG